MLNNKLLYIIEKLPNNQITDLIYAKIKYQQKFNKSLCLSNPISFNEKIQWLKLYNRIKNHSILVDKYSVRKIIEKEIGSDYLIPLIGVYNSISEINIDFLPKSFVIKTTHGSGMNIICLDKKLLDWENKKKILSKWLSQNYYNVGREWIYKHIKPRILCEQLLLNNKDTKIYDYKFFCFSGEPLYIQVDVDRFSKHKRNFYDTNWNIQPFKLNYENADSNIPKSPNFDKMYFLAKKLSSKFPFIRTDFYDTGSAVYFGELTFYPENGFGTFSPLEWDGKLGGLIDLSQIQSK